ncbi:Pathogenesis-related protein 1C [Lachnellula subtilissima]|uniref:Pathogenesis-related protein 1C n=1 Tax=Lachnellula subtilissima TaxID=602034 RepID=A0A8H8S164_9HELO|nr:Pathogenesis-related protein 1C [Lachnellula subtilissima]
MPHDIKSVLKAAIHGFLSPPPSQPNTSPAAHRPRPRPHSHEHEMHDALAAHNAARRSARGGRRPDLKWSEDLAAHAQSWADHLVASRELKHGKYFLRFTFASTSLFERQAWRRRKSLYAHQHTLHAQVLPPCCGCLGCGAEGIPWAEDRRVNLGSYGHYTQVIWPRTTHVGMASAVSYDGRQVIFARYAPCGNVIGMDAYYS